MNELILVVDDEPKIVRLAKDYLEQSQFRVLPVNDGPSALAAARQEKPDLIVLDLNLPGMDGLEVLTEIKSDAELHRTPVVVLTTSRAEEDILRAYGLHANCYIAKPVDFVRFAEVVRAIEHFWFTVVTLPPET